MDFVLDAIEARVLGCLIEKELTTPEYYPLTANSLLAACNQKSNRSPVMNLAEADIIEKVLDLLGWQDLTLKQVTATSTRREDVPDFLLFPDEQAKHAARAEKRAPVFTDEK